MILSYDVVVVSWVVSTISYLVLGTIVIVRTKDFPSVAALITIATLSVFMGIDIGKAKYIGVPVDFNSLKTGEQLFLRMPSNLIAVKDGDQFRIVQNPPVDPNSLTMIPVVIRETKDGKKMPFLPEKPLK